MRHPVDFFTLFRLVISDNLRKENALQTIKNTFADWQLGTTVLECVYFIMQG